MRCTGLITGFPTLDADSRKDPSQCYVDGLALQQFTRVGHVIPGTLSDLGHYPCYRERTQLSRELTIDLGN